ncbi:MAG: ABC transporter substrate-binding protein [Actinomycetaceae bacterium]|nr:ABC transporter substrate-binding protein [Actinomycetaceae bacterium]
MSLKRRFTALISAALVAITAAACSPSGAQSGQSAAAQSGLAQEGVLRVGVPTFPPFVGIENGQITGPEGKIVNEIARLNGWKVEASPYEFSALIPAVQQGRIDIGIGSIFRTKVRAESVDFTAPIYIEPGSIISKEGHSSVRDLVDLRVGTVQGYNWVDDVNKVLGGDLKEYPSSAELKADLEAGRLDAVIDSHGTALYLYKDTPYQVNVIAPDKDIAASTNPGQTAIILQKGNSSLQSQIDASIAELHENGFIAKTLEEAGLDPKAATIGEPSFL